jgi:hypothetical protein
MVYAQAGRAIAQKVFPSVVLLAMNDSKGQPISLGSGFFVQQDVIATNVHVIAGASGGYARLIGQKAKLDIAGIVGIDAKRDLVLLKITGGRAPSLRIGDDAKMAAGDTVYAVGNPAGLEGTFSQGIVSGIRQLEGTHLLQITAPISPGSSGGPILNDLAEVIGVAVATYREGQNLNFAVPSSYLRKLIAEPKQLAALSTVVPSRKMGSSSDSPGDPAKESVVGTNFQWLDNSGYPSKFSFVIRNRLRQSVTDIIWVLIFYGEDGEPIHSEVATLKGPILGSMAKTLAASDFSAGGEPPLYPGHHLRKQTSRVEVRVLNFKVVR